MMKDFSNLIDKISFSNALKKNTLHKVYETINDPQKELLSKTLKVYLLAAISWSISLFSSINWFVFPIISSLIVIYILLFYFKSPNFFKSAAYNSVTYLFTQNALIFYVSSLEISNSNLLNRAISMIYIIVGYSLSLNIVKIKLIENIQETYLSENKQMVKKSIIKMVKIFSSVLVIFIAILIAAMQFYRFNKWWLHDNNYNFLSGLNGSVVGNILSVVSVFIGISVLCLITLLPTLLLNSKIVVDGFVLKKYSEEFRKEYEFTKKEWYSD